MFERASSSLPVEPAYAAVGLAVVGIVVGIVPLGIFPGVAILVGIFLLVVTGVERSLSTSLTRRGWWTIGIVALGILMATWFGTRALEAIVAPLFLAVIAAVIAVSRADRPEYRRVLPENGHVGESRIVRLNFDVDTPAAGIVHDVVGDGLSAVGNRVDETIGTHPIEYEITFERRGANRLGPLSVAVRDVLGLASIEFEYPKSEEVVAYPPIQALTGATRQELNLLAGAAPETERDEFHRLREYVSGDSLRDVHWKTSAKQPDDDLVVKEFVAEDQFGEVQLVAEGPESMADDLAEATASIVVNLVERGVNVGVTVAENSIEPSLGTDHRARVMELLARTDAGEVAGRDHNDADVEVVASDDGITIRMGDHETTFAALTGASLREGRRETAARDADPAESAEVAT